MPAVQIHACCAARGEQGILLLGAPGVGKSDLLLRLIDAGFDLVADDRVDLRGGVASAPEVIGGMLEIRGIGIVKMPFRFSVPIVLVVNLGERMARLPEQWSKHDLTGAPMMSLDPDQLSAVARIRVVLDCLDGTCELLAGLSGGDAIPQDIKSDPEGGSPS